MNTRTKLSGFVGRPVEIGGFARAEFRIGDVVRPNLAADDPERSGLVTSIIIRPASIMYIVSWPDGNERQHYEWELIPILDEGPFADPDRAD